MSIYGIVNAAHSGLRWVVLLLLVAAIVQAFVKRRGGGLYPGKTPVILGAFIVTHIQLLLGLVLYLWLSPKVNFENGMQMGNEVWRFYSIEHLAGMLIAIALITVGYTKAKKQAGINKGWKTVGVYYLIGLILILISIPWPIREGLGGGWY